MMVLNPMARLGPTRMSPQTNLLLKMLPLEVELLVQDQALPNNKLIQDHKLGNKDNKHKTISGEVDQPKQTTKLLNQTKVAQLLMSK